MRERGSASLAAVAVSMVVFVLGALVVDVARVVDTRLRAQTAADAAALAAAAATFESNPVTAADRYSRLNGARLVACRCRVDRSLGSRVVRVVVVIPIDPWLLPFDRVEASATAEYDPVSSTG